METSEDYCLGKTKISAPPVTKIHLHTKPLIPPGERFASFMIVIQQQLVPPGCCQSVSDRSFQKLFWTSAPRIWCFGWKVSSSHVFSHLYQLSVTAKLFPSPRFSGLKQQPFIWPAVLLGWTHSHSCEPLLVCLGLTGLRRLSWADSSLLHVVSLLPAGWDGSQGGGGSGTRKVC